MKPVFFTLSLLLLAIVLLISIGVTLVDKTLTKAEKKAEKQLLLTLNIRKKEIETYYRSVQAEALFWAKNKLIRDNIKQNALTNQKNMSQLLNRLAKEQGYDNIVLATPQGKVIYSVNQQITSLPFFLQPLLKQVKQPTNVYFSDYITTAASNTQQAFVAAGIFNQQTLHGILLIQLSHQPLTKLTKPMSDSHTDIQTLVVGQNKKLRNHIHTTPHKIHLAALTDNLLAYGNQRVFTILDQRNTPFLAAFDFAHVAKNLTWVIISKTDVEQVTKPIKQQIYHWMLLGISLLVSALVVGYFGECWMRKKDEEAVV